MPLVAMLIIILLGFCYAFYNGLEAVLNTVKGPTAWKISILTFFVLWTAMLILLVVQGDRIMHDLQHLTLQQSSASLDVRSGDR